MVPANIFKGWPDWSIHVMRRDPHIGYSDKALSRMEENLSDWEDYNDLPKFHPGSTDWRIRESGHYPEDLPRLKENSRSALDGVAAYKEHEPQVYDTAVDCM